jgi:hypothetical protein
VKFYTNIKKCTFSADAVEFLGFILSPSGLSIMDPAKVQAINDWPEPQKSVKFNYSYVLPTSINVSSATTQKIALPPVHLT